MKPALRILEYYDYSEVSNYIEKKYNLNLRDYAGSHKYYTMAKYAIFDKYGDESWYTTRPADMNENQKLATEEFHGLLTFSPKYLDFWHSLVDHFDFENGGIFTLNLSQRELADSSWKDWELEILYLFRAEFGNEITVIVSW